MMGRARLLGWVAAAALASGCDATGLPGGTDGTPDGLPEATAEAPPETTPENGPMETGDANGAPGAVPGRIVVAPDGPPSTCGGGSATVNPPVPVSDRQPFPEAEFAQHGHGPMIEKGEPLRPDPVLLADGSVRPAATVVTCLLVTWGPDPDGLPVEARP